MRHKTLLTVGSLLLVVSSVLAQSETVVVRPREIPDVLVNPGMGVQTFQRFNGDPLNAGLKWSEAGPTAPLEPAAAAPPDFPASSISYCRWFWSAIEPQPGQFRWEIIDLALREAHEHHQRLAIRIMPYDEGHPLPEWYRNSGARHANKPTDKDGNIWQPDFSDPLYLKDWGELVAAAGARYDGNPYLDTVDISSVGYWGEGWSPYMPAFPYQKALIDIWLDAFQRTPLLMNFDEPEALAYGTEHGAGWRADCWGDMRDTTGGHWCHMLDFYPQQIVQTGIQNVWQRSPVSLETCGVPGGWYQRGWDLDYILSQALRWHVTSVNLKSSAIPPEWKSQVDEFQKRMGYRFILRRLEYPRSVAPGSMALLHMWWLNAGVAPIYRKYWLALQLHNDAGGATIRLPVDIRKWLPGDAVFDGTVYIPRTLPPGAYRVRVGMLDPRTGRPAIRLAIQGRQPDGWYDVGSVEVR
jgi:Domain of unknown function (DUF4832)